jgi:tetratricopeptide (TPR) repeat protein
LGRLRSSSARKAIIATIVVVLTIAPVSAFDIRPDRNLTGGRGVLSNLAKAHADLSQFDDAWRCIGEAITTIETTKERWLEAEVHRTAGEIALLSANRDAAKAQKYFERALTVARQQQAKSWELRASMSLARLWRSQGKVQQARELLAPVYGWFTEGFDTRDLKEAKALIDALA